MDPLAQLSDIHLPPAINQYPIAIGWWLLALIIMTLLITAIIRIRRYKKLHKEKNIALKQLQQNQEMNVDDILLLIKWAALAYFPRQQCANLYGKTLQNFLLTTLPEKISSTKQQQFSEQLEQCTASFERIYHKGGDSIVDKNVRQLALTWLKYALPPQSKTSFESATNSAITNNPIAKQAIKEELS